MNRLGLGTAWRLVAVVGLAAILAACGSSSSGGKDRLAGSTYSTSDTTAASEPEGATPQPQSQSPPPLKYSTVDGLGHGMDFVINVTMPPTLGQDVASAPVGNKYVYVRNGALTVTNDNGGHEVDAPNFAFVIAYLSDDPCECIESSTEPGFYYRLVTAAVGSFDPLPHLGAGESASLAITDYPKGGRLVAESLHVGTYWWAFSDLTNPYSENLSRWTSSDGSAIPDEISGAQTASKF